MADEDKTRPRDWGHHKSPFFQLAPEIRNKIYHETFEGSQRDLVHDPPLTTNVVPVTGRRSVFTTVKSNHQFLLTCFQVYCEALAIYWSLTVIRNGGCRQNPDGHFSRGYFLNRIPAIARQHIQHLRGVKLGPNDWSACRWSQGQAVGLHLSTAPSIGLFPNLKTCSVVVCLCLIHALDRVELEGLQKELDARKSKVRLLVKHIHDLGTHCYLSLSPPFGDLHGYCPFPIQKYTFQDLTSMKTLYWYQPVYETPQLLDDDAAFAMVKDRAPNEIEATMRSLNSNLLRYSDLFDRAGFGGG